jgi:integrase
MANNTLAQNNFIGSGLIEGTRPVDKSPATASTPIDTRIAALTAELALLKAQARGDRHERRRRRVRDRLTDRKIQILKTPGFYSDGGNLYLDAWNLPLRNWVLRYTRGGRAHDYGLGAYPEVSLAEARRARDDALAKLRAGIDPVAARRAERLAPKLERAKTMTFRQCFDGWFQGQEKGWRSPKHARQVRQIFSDYIDPVLGDLPVQMVDTGPVMRIVEPLWLGSSTERAKTETASRARQIIEAVLDWAKARGYRTGENPAGWKGHLETMLPAKSKVRTVTHHRSLPWPQLPAFMARLGQETSLGSLALQVAVLCALRTSEVRLAQWSEIDLPAKVWTLPGARMKAGREHRLPLSEPVVAILEGLRQIATGPFVFANPGAVKPIGQNAMLQVLARLGLKGKVTTHGFRSSQIDWAAETTHFPHEVREATLAHKIPNAVEAAYRRGDLFEKRRELVRQWATYCTSPPPAGEVVNLADARNSA